MNYKELQVKKLTPDAIIPTYAHEGDAGLDLYANEDVKINGALMGLDTWAIVSTGVAVDIPLGYVGLIHPRSGLAAKKGLTVLNAPGTVDAGYRGELKVILANHSRFAANIKKGDRIAQLVIQETVYTHLREVDEFEGFTARETAGFGSTGN